jgi:hypothetical protein
VASTYTVDIRRFTYAELWRIAPGLGFLLAAGHKLLGIPRTMGATVIRLDDLPLVSESELPADVASLMGPLLGAWQALGFRPAFYYTLPFLQPGRRSYAAALLSDDALAVAQVMFAEVTIGGLTRRETVANCFCAMADGTYRGATTERKRMIPAPGFEAVHLPGATPKSLYESCLREVRAAERTHPVPQSPEGLKGLIVRLNNAHVDFQASRGVYVPMDAPA